MHSRLINQYLSFAINDDTISMTKPTTPMHNDNIDRPLEHISNNIANSSNPIPKLQYLILSIPVMRNN